MSFMKLERIEIGNYKGSILSAQISNVYQQFQSHLAEFSSKSYDALNPEDVTFQTDYDLFLSKIEDLDRRLAAILCSAFDDCSNLEGVFKLIDVIGSMLPRPIIREDFTSKYQQIVKLLIEEVDTIETIYNQQMEELKTNGQLKVDKNQPPVAGAIRWVGTLSERLNQHVSRFIKLEDPIKDNEDAAAMLEKYDSLNKSFEEFEETTFSKWIEGVEEKITVNLKKTIITRNSARTHLVLNFHPELEAILREVHYLQLNGKEGIPQLAMDIYTKKDKFREYTFQLGIIIQWYNKMRRESRLVEFELIQEKIENIDVLIKEGEKELTWLSEDLSEYIEKLRALVRGVQEPLSKTQENVANMKKLIQKWAKVPLFQKQESKQGLLELNEKKEILEKRYTEMKEVGEKIHDLLKENKILLEVKDGEESERWHNYEQYIDDMIKESLFNIVGCSLGYIAENMDSENNLPPVMGVQLVFQEPEMILYSIPPIDNSSEGSFIELVEQLIADILHMATLIQRVASTHPHKDYFEDVKSNGDINDMKTEIMDNIYKVVDEVCSYCLRFEDYSYLWLNDRHLYMNHFLLYGRQLTQEEVDTGINPEEQAPTLPDFKEQIDTFESVFNEIEEVSSIEIFNNWFQLDIQPFKLSLLNIVSKWALIFKEHLMDHVSQSLKELSLFLQEEDEGLLSQVAEGDYDGLVKVMGCLMKVKERQSAIDNLFQPLHETIQLLKTYEMELPQESNVLLNELPEQWSNTKKLALTVKQQVAPLQAAEVVTIRKKVVLFEIMQGLMRESFKKSPIFRFDCEEPYNRMDTEHQRITEHEKGMQQIQESASLFEVNIPEFKLLKQCRRELRLLKQLWDYITIVRTCIEDWKTTPWRKVDVENMDIECKKFAKDIRALDKEMRGWDAYIQLEATVKNLLTSLRAVGELQNQAIRERHWQQLLRSTKVSFKKATAFLRKYKLNYQYLIRNPFMIDYILDYISDE